jgi:hypothetical protein
VEFVRPIGSTNRRDSRKLMELSTKRFSFLNRDLGTAMSRKAILLQTLLGLALGACGSLGLSGEPEEMRVEVDATGTSSVQLVTSTKWTYTQDPACNPDEQTCQDVLRVLAADTSVVSAPIRKTLRFTQDFKYLVEVYPSDGVTATLRMKIAIDGKPWFDEARELSSTGNDGAQATLQFVYQWRQPRLQ